MSNEIQALIKWYENLSLVSLQDIGKHYADNSFFKDPFNEFSTLDELIHLYEKMFKQVKEPRFHFIDIIAQGPAAFMSWEMTFMAFGKNQVIRGSTHFKFDQNFKVIYHRDYWDTTEELFQKLPFIGLFFKITKKFF